jgi:glycosyltransferase involved in cell wall biosynthesis
MGSNHPPLVSVLTPVYNGERYLAECIESVLAQSMKDWEYIIADNRSNDQSAAIAERYAAADGRIRVVRCDEFVNVHENFNRSARLMSPNSRYCKFLSADDWMYPECLERMVAVAERHRKVGVVSSYRLEDKRLLHDGLLPYTDEVMDGAQVVRAALLGWAHVTGSPSQLLYRADLVRRAQPFFDQTMRHSDTLAAFRTLLDCDLGFVHQVLTFTRLHTDALTSTSHRINTYLPNEIRALILYGRKALGAREYRTAMRSWLRRYGWYLLKQNLKPSRLHDVEFHDFHHDEIGRMLADLKDDAQTRIALQGLRVLVRKPRR